jgi:hypothetical protein
MNTRPRRLAFFVLGIAGGLASGVGATTTWRSIDFAGGITTDRGVDLLWGKVALALSVTAIILTLISRKGSSEEPRPWTIAALLPVGLVLSALGGLALSQASFVYGAATPAKALTIAAAHGEIRTIGLGPTILICGGFLMVLAAGSGLIWIRAWRRAAQPAPNAELPQDGADPAD